MKVDKNQTIDGNPTKASVGARSGGKMCLYNGSTQFSSTRTIPLVSRNGS